jgi:hypothetical protein
MAKKKKRTAKPPAAKARRKPAGKSAKKPAHEHNLRGHDHEHHHDESCEEAEIELDDTEKEAIDKVFVSDELRLALETEVDAAVTTAVRKVCRQYGTPLSTEQAQNVAIVLFGD